MAQPNDSTNVVKVFLTDNTHRGIAEDKIYSLIAHHRAALHFGDMPPPAWGCRHSDGGVTGVIQNAEPLGVYPYLKNRIQLSDHPEHRQGWLSHG